MKNIKNTKKLLRRAAAAITAVSLLITPFTVPVFAAVTKSPVILNAYGDRTPAGTIIRFSKSEQTLSDEFVGAFKRFDKSLNITALANDARFTTTKVFEVFEKTLIIHPELFYVGLGMNFNVAGKVGKYSRFVLNGLNYSIAQAYFDKYNTRVLERAQLALDYIKDAKSDYERALLLHDYLANNIDYDNATRLSIRQNATVSRQYIMSSGMYGALVTRRAMCAGYAQTYKFLLNKCGIPCEVILAPSAGHALNIVKIDKNWYNVDITKDDASTLRHDRFMKSDKAFDKLGYNNGLRWNFPEAFSAQYDDPAYTLRYRNDAAASLFRTLYNISLKDK